MPQKEGERAGVKTPMITPILTERTTKRACPLFSRPRSLLQPQGKGGGRNELKKEEKPRKSMANASSALTKKEGVTREGSKLNAGSSCREKKENRKWAFLSLQTAKSSEASYRPKE